MFTLNQELLGETLETANALPQFGDWPFAFARIDAVYVRTQGGYRVGRDPDDYPLFLAVRERDVEAWQGFFERFGLPTAFERQPRALDGPLQVVLVVLGAVLILRRLFMSSGIRPDDGWNVGWPYVG